MALYNAWGFDVNQDLPTSNDPSPNKVLLWDNHGKSYINMPEMEKWYNKIIAHGPLSKDLAAKHKTVLEPIFKKVITPFR